MLILEESYVNFLEHYDSWEESVKDIENIFESCFKVSFEIDPIVTFFCSRGHTSAEPFFDQNGFLNDFLPN